MTKKTVRSSGLVTTISGILQYPRATPMDDVNPIQNGNDSPVPTTKVGDKVWKWTHNLRMSKKTVGIVTDVRCPHSIHQYTIRNLNGDDITIYEHVLLTDVEYADASNYL